MHRIETPVSTIHSQGRLITGNGTQRTREAWRTELTVIKIERRIGQQPQKRVDRFEQLDALVQQLPAEEDLGVCEDMQYQPF